MGLANRLTESLRNTGDLEIAEPSFATAAYVTDTDFSLAQCSHSIVFRQVEDRDGDQIMFTAANRSQFTQSLLLFVRSPLVSLLDF